MAGNMANAVGTWKDEIVRNLKKRATWQAGNR